MGKWDREDAAASLGIHYRYTNLHNRTYSYTEPFTEGTIHLQTAVDPVSGKYISAAIHTHGAWMRTSTGKGEELNEDFSLNDMLYIEEFGKPFYLVTYSSTQIH